MDRTFFLLFCCFDYFVDFDCRPIADDPDVEMALEYLQRYNYIGETSPGAQLQALTDLEPVLTTGLFILQKKFHLNATGTLTNETRDFMSQPRCGNADIVHVEDIPGITNITRISTVWDSPEIFRTISNRTKRYATVGYNVHTQNRSRSVQHGTTSTRSKRYTTLGYKVLNSVRTLTYKFDNFPASGIEDKQLVRDVFRQAAQIWERQSQLPFRFLEVDRDFAADFSILFYHADTGAYMSSDGPAGVLAYASPVGRRQVTYLHFDDAEDWYMGPAPNLRTLHYHLVTKDMPSMLYTSVHELGHVIGLGHSGDRESIMYPTFDPYSAAERLGVKLGRDDQLAIRAIYGSREIDSNPSADDFAMPTEVPPICTSAQPIKAVLYHLFTGDNIYGTFALMSTLVFSGDEYYRVNQQRIMAGYPRKIQQDFEGLPSNFDYAFSYIIYVSPLQRRSYTQRFGQGIELDDYYTMYVVNDFFVGGDIYRFVQDQRAGADNPLPAQDVYPEWRDTFTNAFYWIGNDQLYMFEGNQYYRYESDLSDIAEGYPRPISNWAGLPSNIDAVFSAADLKMYFVDGDDVYEFFTNTFEVTGRSSFRVTWLGCTNYDSDGNFRLETPAAGEINDDVTLPDPGNPGSAGVHITPEVLLVTWVVSIACLSILHFSEA